MAPWTLALLGNEYGQLGVGDTEDRSEPILIESIRNMPVLALVLDRSHSFALDTDGFVHFWGLGKNGISGINDEDATFLEPTKIPELSRIVAIDSSHHHAAALNDQGHVICWGWLWDLKGETYSEIPTRVDSRRMGKVVAIGCGHHFNVVVNVKGEVWSWGRNKFGQLGSGNCIPSDVPIKLEMEEKIKIAACGKSHVIVITENNQMYGYGRSLEGQLGAGEAAGSEEFQLTPQPIKIELEEQDFVVGVSCGDFHTVCWTNNGHVFSFGEQKEFRLGYKTEAIQYEPKQIESLKGVIECSIAGFRNLALTWGGTVYYWGEKIEYPKILEYSAAVELEALQIRATHVACGPNHVIIHGGPRGRPNFVPPLDPTEHQAIQNVLHAHLNGAKRNNKSLLAKEKRLLVRHEARLRFEREWNDLVLEGSKIEEASDKAERDPLGTAQMRFEKGWNIKIGIADESSRKRRRNVRKGKAGVFYTQELQSGMSDVIGVPDIFNH